MSGTAISRREAMRLLALSAGTAALAACGATPTPQVVEKVVEREVTKIVEGTPQVVKETVVVEKVVTVEGPVAEQITVKVSGWGDVLGKTELLEQTFFTSFKEAYPNVTIQYEPAPWNEYWTKLHAMAASGDIYDLFAMSVAYGWDFANKKITLNLQPYIDTEINTDEYFMEMELNCHRYPNMQTGDLYAFPIRWVGASLFYNVDMFDEVGLAYPDDKWTYDDMLTAAQALTKVSGDKTERWGMMAPAGHVALDAMIKANGGEVVSKDYRKCMLTEPAAVESIQWAVDCIQKHNVAPTPAAAAGFAEGTFASKVVGMVIDGSYMMNPWEQAEFNWDVSWIPNGKVSRVMYGGPDSLSIARLTKAREAAWALLKHWVSEEQQMIMDIFPPGSVPFLRKAAYSDKWLGRGNMPKGAKTVLDMAPVLRGADFGSQWMEWRVTIMNQELDLAYLGERSVEESVQAACAGIDQVLANIEWPV